MCGDQPDIHGGHSHEYAGNQSVVARNVIPHLISIELRQHLDASAGHERTQQRVDETVHMMQGQAVEDDVDG
jgi:hypothetical protein